MTGKKVEAGGIRVAMKAPGFQGPLRGVCQMSSRASALDPDRILRLTLERTLILLWRPPTVY